MTVSRPDVPAPQVYDPLALGTLQRMLREEMEGRTLEDFPPRDFRGAGLYALYYVGDLDIYAPLVTSDRPMPLYVGKAEAGNSGYGEPTDEVGFQLFNRIKKHAGSVAEVTENLATRDFRIRFLPLDDAWIVLGERALLRAYRPVLWNTLLPGFGANPPGTARQNARSIWDTVHPGRERAGNLCSRRFTLAEMLERIEHGVVISLMDEGPARDRAIANLGAYRRPWLWKPNGSKPIVVNDEDRFLSEMARLGLELPDYRPSTEGEPEPVPDPEEQVELNTRAAEDAEAAEEA